MTVRSSPRLNEKLDAAKSASISLRSSSKFARTSLQPSASKPMKHQVMSLAHDEKNDVVYDCSDAGCVSADTEFLTPTGWKRIDCYAPGDEVAQFWPETREIEFVKPNAYIKKPCDRMIAIAPVRGMSQRLSHEHRVLYYRNDGSYAVCSADEYMRRNHKSQPSHLGWKFCSTFSVRSERSLSLTENELRVMVAVIADGHFNNPNSARCVVRLKKSRKIERLSALLLKSGIEYRQRSCNSQPDFQVFTFYAPRRDKSFGKWWWDASQSQLEVIADELPHWDSAIDKRESGGVRFSAFLEETANFAQYAFAAAKHPASLNFTYRDRTHEGRGTMLEYVVHAKAEDGFIGPGRRENIFEVPNREGFKYCFEVDSSFLLLRHNGYIFATGNTGKTYVRIASFARRRAKKNGCALILAPKSLLRSAWANDFKKFAPNLKVSVATADKREEAFRADADAYITNHDAVKWIVKQKKGFLDRFTDLIIDEPTAYKHHTSQRSRAMAKIAKHFWRPGYKRVGMTATPNSNGICDVWHQVFILDGGKRLGPHFYAFRSSVCVPKQVGRNVNAVEWQDKDGAEEAVFGELADIVVRHRLDDCTDIPATNFIEVPYELPPAQRKAYDQLELTQLMIFGDDKVTGALTGTAAKVGLTAINAAAVATKLLQTASGAVYDDAGNARLIDTGRYELILDLVEARAGKHPLVFFQWKHQKEQLVAQAQARKLSYAVIDGEAKDAERDAIVKAYQAGAYDVLFAHPRSAAHGLTLTRGTSTIWTGPTYDLELYEQGNKRQRRIGQKNKTEVVMVLAEETIEEKVYDLLQGKDARMKNLLDLFASMKR